MDVRASMPTTIEPVTEGEKLTPTEHARRGGQGRAEALTSEERSDISRLGAERLHSDEGVARRFAGRYNTTTDHGRALMLDVLRRAGVPVV